MAHQNPQIIINIITNFLRPLVKVFLRIEELGHLLCVFNPELSFDQSES
jgi:hypothetical protein